MNDVLTSFVARLLGVGARFSDDVVTVWLVGHTTVVVSVPWGLFHGIYCTQGLAHRGGGSVSTPPAARSSNCSSSRSSESFSKYSILSIVETSTVFCLRSLLSISPVLRKRKKKIHGLGHSASGGTPSHRCKERGIEGGLAPGLGPVSG